jgi:hypothetical protein
MAFKAVGEPLTYEEQMSKARYATGAMYGDAYEAEQRKRLEARYAEEIPAAEAMRQAAMSGEMQAGQRLAAGQDMQQAAVAAASGNPLAARGAQFAGAGQALQTSMQGAQQGQQALEAGTNAALAAHMRQIDYGQAVQTEELRKQALAKRAAQQQYQLQQGVQARQDADDRRFGEAVLGAANTGLGYAGQALGGPKA